jgi:hypothetical protein
MVMYLLFAARAQWLLRSGRNGSAALLVSGLSAPGGERLAAPAARLPEQAQVSGEPAIPLRWPAAPVTQGPGDKAMQIAPGWHRLNCPFRYASPSADCVDNPGRQPW